MAKEDFDSSKAFKEPMDVWGALLVFMIVAEISESGSRASV